MTSGTGAYIVTAVGVRTTQGQIIKDSTSEEEETPLQKKLDVLATKIGYIGMAAAVLTFIAMMIIKATGGGTSADKSWGSWTVTAFIYAITIVVVAIPEGLPLAVTISLAFSTGKMLKDKNLIRHLDACETMGNATDICTDKTGTLTENQMTVVEAWLGGVPFTFSTSRVGELAPPLTPPAAVPPILRDMLRDHLAVNSTASVIELAESNVSGGPATGAVAVREEVRGSKTEGAGLKLVAQLDPTLTYTAIRAAVAAENRLIKQFAFSSERKMMSTIVELPDGRVRVYTTGGSDMVLSRSASMVRLSASGAELEVLALSDARVSDIITRIITPMAQQSLRTIAVAYRDFPNRSLLPPSIEEHPEQELTIYGILGIKDPLRRGVAEAVALANRAGVRVRMVTGDNKVTASAIARECGILSRPDDLVLEGPLFRTLTPAQLDQILPRLAVLARSSPKDKMILVRRLNGNLPHNEAKWKADHPDGNWATERDLLLPGHFNEWKTARKHANGTLARGVVGVTGDGTNDAPALHASDVGLAMGLAGTAVAKESADIIITDDNFASIISAIRWGRSVYDNVRCFLQFQLTVNVVALLLTFIAAVMQTDPPLNPVMMLWVNLIMDTMGALALATQAPSDELLARRPFGSSAFLVSSKMWRHILVQSVFQLTMLLVLLRTFAAGEGITVEWLAANKKFVYAGGATHDDIVYYTNTFIFNTFVFCQIWNEFNARSLDDRWNVFRGLGDDRAFIAIIVISAGVQALLVEFAGSFIQCTGLTWRHWLMSIAISLITFPLGVLMRWIPIKDKESDFAEYYRADFDAAMARQLAEAAAAGNPHPALARSGGGGASAVKPSLNLSARVHGMPGSSGSVGGGAPAARDAISVDVSMRHSSNGSAGASGGSTRSDRAMDAPIAGPMSPTNDLAMISGLMSVSSSSPVFARLSRHESGMGFAHSPASLSPANMAPLFEGADADEGAAEVAAAAVAVNAKADGVRASAGASAPAPAGGSPAATQPAGAVAAWPVVSASAAAESVAANAADPPRRPPGVSPAPDADEAAVSSSARIVQVTPTKEP